MTAPRVKQPGQADEPPSKTAIKRAFKARQVFAGQLVLVPEKYLVQLGLSDPTMDEIRFARSMNKSALKRQIGFISKRLADEDVEAAEQALANLQQPDAVANARFHDLERWRDSLIDGDENSLQILASQHAADLQQLRTLIRNAQLEKAQQQPPKAARQLFKLLRRLTEE